MADKNYSSPPWAEIAKFAAAKEALKFAGSCSSIGLGSGTTAEIFVSLLAEHAKKNNLQLKCVATSKKIEKLAKESGLNVLELEEAGQVDLAVDGADEADGRRRLIKGHGGAATREKIVDYMAKKLVIIADESKLSKRLHKQVPVEFLPFAKKAVESRLAQLGAKAITLRKNEDGSAYITDNGFFIFHADFGEIKNPKKLEEEINKIPGVLENGIFAKRPADMIILGKKDGSTKIVGKLDS